MDSSCAPFQEFVEQTLGLLLNGKNVGANLSERAQRRGLVEISSEGDLIAGFDGAGINPGVRHVGLDFAPEECLDAAGFEQRYLLRVTEVRVGFVFDDASL